MTSLKIGLETILDEKNLLSHWVLEAVTQYPQIVEEFRESQEVEVQVLINGRPADVNEFAQHWQKCVNDSLNHRAAEIVREKLGDLSELVSDFSRDVTNFIEFGIVPEVETDEH